MNNPKALILKIIEDQVNEGKLTFKGKKVLKVHCQQFTKFKIPLDKLVTQIGSDSIYYEDLTTGRIVSANFTCRIVEEGSENSTYETNGSGSFRGEYDTESNSFKEGTCVVTLNTFH
jgi:hypothetical protein